jgi:hypothetical protein
MFDMASIQAAVTGLKAATDIAKGFMELKTITEVQGKVIELQTVILSAQSSAIAAQSDQFALLQRVSDLEAKMADMEAWDAEKQRYRLTQFPPGVLIYVLKDEASASEPIHRLCANCFENRKRSFLQSRGFTEGIETLHCYGCKSDFHVGTPAPMREYRNNSIY